MNNLNLNSLILLIGLCAHSVAAFIYVDNRFDRIEDAQLIDGALGIYAWDLFEAEAAWAEFRILNPHLNIELPNLRAIKHKK